MSDEFRPRMQITEEDLAGTDVDDRIGQMRAARAAPPVQTVGAPSGSVAGAASGGKNWWRSTTATLALAGLAGGVLAWAAVEVIAQPDSDHHWYGNNGTASSVVFVGLFAMILGAVIAAWDGIELKDWTKARTSALRAAPYLILGGVVGGVVAQQVWEAIMKPALERANSLDDLKTSLHLGRGLAISAAAGAVGVALGAAAKSGRKAVNGGIGGLAGGFIGGFLFDYVAEQSSGTSAVMPRLVALTITGVFVGAAIGLIETARREHWLEIVSGGMAGKQFILYHDQTTIGSGSGCHITLIKDPGIAPSHLVLNRQGDALVMRAGPGMPVLVNGIPSDAHTLQDGDLVQAGQTVLRYRAKANSVPLPGGIN